MDNIIDRAREAVRRALAGKTGVPDALVDDVVTSVADEIDACLHEQDVAIVKWIDSLPKTRYPDNPLDYDGFLNTFKIVLERWPGSRSPGS